VELPVLLLLYVVRTVYSTQYVVRTVVVRTVWYMVYGIGYMVYGIGGIGM
jgi:hypothetical protein